VTAKKVSYPIVYVVWYIQLCELLHETRMSDRVKRLSKLEGSDVGICLADWSLSEEEQPAQQ